MSQELNLKVSDNNILYDLLFKKVDLGNGVSKAILHTNPSVSVKGVCMPYNPSSSFGVLTDVAQTINFGGSTTVNISLFNLSEPETQGLSPKILISLDDGNSWNTVLPLQERSWDISRTSVIIKAEDGKTANCELSYLV